jgi:hypothetical protein
MEAGGAIGAGPGVGAMAPGGAWPCSGCGLGNGVVLHALKIPTIHNAAA